MRLIESVGNLAVAVASNPKFRLEIHATCVMLSKKDNFWACGVEDKEAIKKLIEKVLKG